MPRKKSEEQTDDGRFSEIVIESAILWNTVLEGNSKSGKKRDDLWGEIVDELEAKGIRKSAHEIIKKWQYMKHEFGRQMKKKPSGPSASRVKKWQWFDSLRFLRDDMQPSSTVGNLALGEGQEDGNGSTEKRDSSTLDSSDEKKTAEKTGAQRYAMNRIQSEGFSVVQLGSLMNMIE